MLRRELLALIIVFGAFSSPTIGLASVKPSSCQGLLARAQSPRVLPRIEIYKEISSEITNFDVFAKRRYGKAGAAALATLRSIAASYEVLIADPGVFFRIKQFESFIRARTTEPETRPDPWRARMQFSRHLGYRTVYRGVAVTAKQAKKILADGMESRFLWAGNWPTANPQRSLFGDIRFQVLGAKAGTDPNNNPILSVSDNPVIALFAANRKATFPPSAHSESPKLEPYIFEFRVPELDILYQGGPDSPIPYPTKRNWMNTHISGKPVFIKFKNGRALYEPVDRSLESFIFYGLEPGEIVSVRKADTDEWAE